ncbi:uracil-DNA glycosylase family 4 [Deinococcus metalli]|uniref:DNA polymerase n=1 Tax=Deinococcus metalli TaxID=1141878 RepID=A0A7W8KK35_9DEIO|nr:uracil-DNA glycosylase [Deinococcus metalli]MBB5379273.1 uracil-DNA glycosylase family 4 [Deinococcus metalli]GHF65961.1 DNA polymerase [Deinococcus metalli]
MTSAAALPGMNRARAFATLVDDVQSCQLCPRMAGRARVLSHANGSPGARVLFVAEAPGRLGAERTHVPLQGDQTGRNFEVLLASIGLERADTFITNAVLCNPQDSAGRNSPPARDEVQRCAQHLGRTLEVVGPEVVVTLGRVALESLRTVEEHAFTLAADVGQCRQWAGRVLVPMYHPGARARVHRPLPQQLQDFQALASVLDVLPGRCSKS